jgi:PIN domain nuclease of toxin-antitoxin system
VLLLLDTHILLSLADDGAEQLPAFIDKALTDRRNALFASAASLWEMAIKHRLGKLPLSCPLDEWPDLLAAMGVTVMDIHASHVLADADPPAETKDPFDRLLLAICQREAMRLVTLDRLLLRHPIALLAASA